MPPYAGYFSHGVIGMNDDLVEAVTDAIQKHMGEKLFIGLKRGPAKELTEALVPIVARACAEVFSDDVVEQSRRFSIAPAQNESPGQWMARVRTAAIRELGGV